MKAAEGSCEKVTEYVRALGPDFSVMSGDDSLTLPFMSAGARGVISVASVSYILFAAHVPDSYLLFRLLLFISLFSFFYFYFFYYS